MKKLIISLLVLLGLQTQAQINFCDSISYTTSSTINYPLILSGNASGLANMVDTITWSWTVCNTSLCYSGSGPNASFGQVSLTDTLKVCYDVYITINNMSYACTGCDSLVYNPNSYQWEAMTAQPLTITELLLNTVNDGRMYDLLGREIFEVPLGVMYIKNNKKHIRR
tara:strand:- start:141 stop:644 length:504 start_codon:yes stop_codon:yes gene_type:complete